MARGDGIDRTTVRNERLTTAKIANTQRHNERKKDSYVNQDIVPERTPMNVHFKKPSADYVELFEQMTADGIISTRGTKEDAYRYGELIFDVNSAYFYNHGGYEFAKQFYHEAYRAAIKIVGGEQYILSAVMHADERNRAMSEALGKDVYHYHLHVVYVPVVEKQILWTKRCKDKSLVGTVKKTVMQVSMSKKWASEPAVNEATGETLRNAKGKPVLKKSYSILQDDFYNHMVAAGYTDIQRGERGSSEEHLTVTQFKVAQEHARLTQAQEATLQAQAEADRKKWEANAAEKKLAKAEARIETAQRLNVTYGEIGQMGKKSLTRNITFTPKEASALKTMAQEALSSRTKIYRLEDALTRAKHDAEVWKKRYDRLTEKAAAFLTALECAPKRVMEFLREVISREAERSEAKTSQKKREIEVER